LKSNQKKIDLSSKHSVMSTKHNKMQNLTETTPQVINLTQVQPPKQSATQRKLDKLKKEGLKLENDTKLCKKDWFVFRGKRNLAQQKVDEKKKEVEDARNKFLAILKPFKELEAELVQLENKKRTASIKYRNSQIFTKRNKEEIENIEKIETIKQEVATNERKEKTEKKQQVKENKKNTVLKRIEVLPDELKRYIQSYLTYQTQIEVLETKYKIQQIIKNMRYNTDVLLRKMCTSPEYFSTLSAEEALTQTFVPGVPFKPYYICKGAQERKMKIQQVLQKMKAQCPAFALKTIKILAIMLGKKPTAQLVQPVANA
jgi:chromosome segregation ATPase